MLALFLNQCLHICVILSLPFVVASSASMQGRNVNTTLHRKTHASCRFSSIDYHCPSVTGTIHVRNRVNFRRVWKDCIKIQPGRYVKWSKKLKLYVIESRLLFPNLSRRLSVVPELANLQSSIVEKLTPLPGTRVPAQCSTYMTLFPSRYVIFAFWLWFQNTISFIWMHGFLRKLPDACHTGWCVERCAVHAQKGSGSLSAYCGHCGVQAEIRQVLSNTQQVSIHFHSCHAMLYH